MKKIFFIIFSIVLLGGGVLLSGCLRQSTNISVDQGDTQILVSILPQVDFVEKIGGDKVSVNAMIPPGFSPETYSPSPQELKQLQSAEIYFRIGPLPFEETNMSRMQDINKNMVVIDTSVGITLRTLAGHVHDGADTAHKSGDDPHIWLSPDLVKIQAGNIYQALVNYKPEYKDYFAANYNQFLADLDGLDQQLKNTLSPIKGQTILVFHPSFGYLADAYGFKQEAIQIEGKDPSPENLKNIIDEAKADNVKVIFVQQQFSTKSAEAIAEAIQGTVVSIDPLAQDYFGNLKQLANTIVNNLK